VEAAIHIPERPTLRKLRDAAADCRACPLWRGTTQTVFGEGPAKARLMLIGEQPGDREDREGKPFVGPAGRVLGEGLAEAGIDPREAYVTNAVKHFKFTERGKRRLHQKPTRGEVGACSPWLDGEIDLVRPQAIVALGATAAQRIFGPSFRVTRERGDIRETEYAPLTMATFHPSAILRARTSEERAEAMADFVADLRKMAKALGSDP
jgi:DNA polymerase